MVETRKAKLQIAAFIAAVILLAAYAVVQAVQLKKLNHALQQNWTEVQNAYLQRADLMIAIAPQVPRDKVGKFLMIVADLRRSLTPPIKSNDYVGIQNFERPVQESNVALAKIRGRIISPELAANFERIKEARRRYVDSQLDIQPKISKFPVSMIAYMTGIPKVVFLTGAQLDSERMPYFGF